jgi:hypothetical protein
MFRQLEVILQNDVPLPVCSKLMRRRVVNLDHLNSLVNRMIWISVASYLEIEFGCLMVLPRFDIE